MWYTHSNTVYPLFSLQIAILRMTTVWTGVVLPQPRLPLRSPKFPRSLQNHQLHADPVPLVASQVFKLIQIYTHTLNSVAQQGIQVPKKRWVLCHSFFYEEVNSSFRLVAHENDQYMTITKLYFWLCGSQVYQLFSLQSISILGAQILMADDKAQRIQHLKTSLRTYKDPPFVG